MEGTVFFYVFPLKPEIWKFMPRNVWDEYLCRSFKTAHAVHKGTRIIFLC